LKKLGSSFKSFHLGEMAACKDPNENRYGSQQYNPIQESHSGYQQNMIVGEPAIQHEGQENGAEAANSEYKPALEDPYEENNDCFRVVRSSKRMEIPCTRNEYQKYKVKVSRQVHEQVPRRVEYTDYEIREREEPYSVKRFETAYRDEDQQYTVQVPKKVTKMVKVTKRVPRTVYVNIVVEEPREETIMVSETRNRRVKVPYQKEVVDQKYRTVKESIPVTKFRTEYDTVAKTVYEDAWRTKVVPVTKLIHKEIPVYNVVRNENCRDCVQVDAYQTNYEHVEQPVEVLPESTYNAKQYVETYAPYIETHPEPTPIYQVAPQYEPQPVTNTHLMQDHGPAAATQPSPDVEQAPEYTPVKNPAPVMDNPEAAMVANASEPHEEQKVEKWVETQYSAPAEYDANNDGVLDAQEREVARKDGKLHVDRIAVVQNSQEGDAVVEELVSQPPRQNRRRKKNKSGGRRKRRSRR